MRSRRSAAASTHLILALMAVAVGIVAGYFGRPLIQPVAPSTPTGQPGATLTSVSISALARLQPLGGAIPIYGPPGDRIESLDVHVGDWLKMNDPIAVLASKHLRDQEVKVADLQLAEAKEQANAAKVAAQAKIATAALEASQALENEEADTNALNLQLSVLQEQQKFATDQQARLQRVKSQGVRVADEDWDQARLLLLKSNAEIEGIQSKLVQVRAGYERAKKLAESKKLSAEKELVEASSRVPLKSAEEKLTLARTMAHLATLTAPTEGTVLRVVSNVGDPTGSQQPVIYLGNVSKMVAMAEIYESDVPRIYSELDNGRGFDATITLPGVGILKGSLSPSDTGSQPSRMITRNAIFALSPREDADRRVIEATILLDEKSSKDAARYVGVQVTVHLTSHSANSGK